LPMVFMVVKLVFYLKYKYNSYKYTYLVEM
jgi:hypothetical protein